MSDHRENKLVKGLIARFPRLQHLLRFLGILKYSNVSRNNRLVNSYFYKMRDTYDPENRVIYSAFDRSALNSTNERKDVSPGPLVENDL